MGISNGDISIVDALIVSAVGIVIVFAVLAILMGIIMLMGLIMDKSPALAAKMPWLKRKKKAAEEEAAPADAEPAPGSCGELVLVKTEDRDAAMIMAIVADTLGAPLNTLRFKSIKRLEDGPAGDEKEKEN